MHGNKDITDLVERLEAFEDRLEVRIESLYAILDCGSYVCPTIVVRGEVHPRNGTNLKESFELVLDVHDQSGRLIATQAQMFLEDSFFGFKTFQQNVWLQNGEFAKVRLYPRPL